MLQEVLDPDHQEAGSLLPNRGREEHIWCSRHPQGRVPVLPCPTGTVNGQVKGQKPDESLEHPQCMPPVKCQVRGKGM